MNIFAAGNGEGVLDYLGTDTTIISILTSNVLLLLAILIRLQQMRHDLSRKSNALEQSKQHLQVVGDNLPSITIFQLERSHQNNFKFHYISKGYQRVLGLDPNWVLQDARIALEHIYEADIPALKQAYRSAMKNLEPADLEIRVLDVSGKLKWLRVSAVPHLEKNALIWDGFMQDISDSKNIENALSEEKHNLQNLFETIDDFLLVCDMNGNLLHTNPSVRSRLEYPKEELDEMSLFELYPENLRTEIYQIIALMQSEQSTICGLPLQMKTGDTISAEMNIFQGSWKNQKAIFGVARDTTHRRQTETALRESQQMLQLIMDTIPLSVFWKDKDSIYLGGNKAFLQSCGIESLNNLIGKNPYDLFDPSTAPGVIKRDQEVIAGNQPFFNLLQSHRLSDGSIGWREISKIPLQDENGRAVGVLGVWRDVTEQNLAKEHLKRTLEDMERFNQLMRVRERRTLELKAEVNHLLSELDRKVKYQTTADGLK
ncbi:MAG: PAS domain S-box protein [Verrucomicrobiota bacterium]